MLNASSSHFDPTRHRPVEILQRSSLLPYKVCYPFSGKTREALLLQPPRPDLRPIQVWPKDFPAMPRQSGGAAPATFVGGLAVSERVVDEGQSWASDIIGVLSGVGLYSVLIFLATFLRLYVPA